MATRLMMMALSGWLSACYSLPSDGCVPGSCLEGLALSSKTAWCRLSGV